MSAQPVACTLTADQRRCDAHNLIPGLAAKAATREWTPNGLRLSFAAEATTLESIASVIERERQCCAFLTFQLVVPEASGDFVLELSGPPGTREFLEELPHLSGSDAPK